MGRKREVAAARCVKHPDGHVIAQGRIYETGSGRRRQYRCTPLVGEQHWFSVSIGDDGVPAASWSPPPTCDDHPAARVIRFGTYGKTTGKPRQRYRCFPDDGSKPHTFTPPLPREHAQEGHEQCDHCDEHRGVHHGETSVARTHSWNTRTVARALGMLASGESYAATSKWALRMSGTGHRRVRRTRDEEGNEVTATDAASEARRSWHIAADWCEVFGPVVYEQVEQKLKAQALAERARLDALLEVGKPLERPQVVLLDEHPVYGRTLDRRKRSRRDDGFWLLVLAELHWPPQPDDPFTVPAAPRIALRIVRAMAKSNTPAWRLVFDELGYAPDFIVADAATSIASAIREHFDPGRTCFIPSLWHLTRAIERDLLRINKATVTGDDGPQLIGPLAEHLRQLSRRSGVLADAVSWSAWWDELFDLLGTHRLPVEQFFGHRDRYEPAMAAALTAAASASQVPLSTGGLETLIDSQVKRLLSPRRTAFGNIERTNNLFDLVVARQHGAFDNLGQTAALIRNDALAYMGYALPLRRIADPRPADGSYSSLRDMTLLNELAREKGLL